VRTLHDIVQHEKLVARGQYRFTRDGQDSGKVEHWNLHALPDGSSVLRADVDGRETAEASSVLVHMLLDPGGHADRLHVRCHDKRRKAEAQLTIFPDYAILTRSRDWQALLQVEVELPGGVVVAAPCLASSVARAYHEGQEERQPVRVLELNLAGEGSDLLAPALREVALAFEGTEEVNLPGLGHFQARRVAGDGVDVLLDDYGVALTCRWHDPGQEAQAATLAQYARFDV
jgi:hypothetical protein